MKKQSTWALEYQYQKADEESPEANTFGKADKRHRLAGQFGIFAHCAHRRRADMPDRDPAAYARNTDGKRCRDISNIISRPRRSSLGVFREKRRRSGKTGKTRRDFLHKITPVNNWCFQYSKPLLVRQGAGRLTGFRSTKDALVRSELPADKGAFLRAHPQKPGFPLQFVRYAPEFRCNPLRGTALFSEQWVVDSGQWTANSRKPAFLPAGARGGRTLEHTRKYETRPGGRRDVGEWGVN
jgi:hypothetical protein